MSEKVKPPECYVEQQFLFVQIQKKFEEPQDPSKELETFSMVLNKTFSATFIREVLYIYIFESSQYLWFFFSRSCFLGNIFHFTLGRFPYMH